MLCTLVYSSTHYFQLPCNKMYNLQGTCIQPYYLVAELYTVAIINHHVGSHYHSIYVSTYMHVLL